MTSLSSPLLLGFEDIERAIGRSTRSGDGYPPYNVERLPAEAEVPERIRITLAVAGFKPEELTVTIEDGQLAIRGRQTEEAPRMFLHRGIAARQFQRVFVLAEGMDVLAADLSHGLLTIDLARPEPARTVRKIDIAAR
ncbi:Hsp20 family protein [Terrihabitans sp. B22-R8]|uniref:Hsp20 family protein n=1 Tax=Terrihabitans sp. B22-R8 TaxID=3425128 RepID=UPI00403D24CD